MTSRVLVDAGPLVALGSRSDQYHQAAVNTLKRLTRPLLSCWPVITEAAYLLRDRPAVVRELLLLTSDGSIQLLDLAPRDVPSINRILERYESQRLQLADAALMHLAHRERIDMIFTFDHRDFSSYRLPSGKHLTIVGAGE